MLFFFKKALQLVLQLNEMMYFISVFGVSNNKVFTTLNSNYKLVSIAKNKKLFTIVDDRL